MVPSGRRNARCIVSLVNKTFLWTRHTILRGGAARRLVHNREPFLDDTFLCVDVFNEAL